MKTHELYVGQYEYASHPQYPGVYRVAGAGTRGIKLIPVTVRRLLTVPESMIRPPTEGELATAKAAAPPPVEHLGTVVRYHNPKAPAGHLFVVIKLHRDGRFNLAQLGGDGNRYWAKVLPLSVTIVPAAEVEKAYTDAGGTL
jgi:hypothetical protein